MTNRNVIVHAHIFKNAGSSFDDTLLTNFGDDFIDHREDSLISNDKNFLENYLKENNEVKAFSSHSVYHKPKDFDNVKIHSVYFLRNPIERIKSVYNFEKKQPTRDSSGAKMAKTLNFEEYVAWRMQDDVPATIRNLQTIFLAGDGPHPRYMEKKFALALENLDSTHLLGIVDRYDESMVVFEDYLKQFFSKIDLSYIRRNITDQNLTDSIEIKIEKITNELGTELVSIVNKKNTYDLELYRKSNQLLNEKIINILDFQHKLVHFKERCLIKLLKQKLVQKKYDEIIQETQHCIDNNCKNIQYYLVYAQALIGLKQFDDALLIYDRAILIHPNNEWLPKKKMKLLLIINK